MTELFSSVPITAIASRRPTASDPGNLSKFSWSFFKDAYVRRGGERLVGSTNHGFQWTRQSLRHHIAQRMPTPRPLMRFSDRIFQMMQSNQANLMPRTLLLCLVPLCLLPASAREDSADATIAKATAAMEA